MSSKWPTAIDLFAGGGGATQGLKEARFRVLAAVEVDPLAAETYKKNHPGVKLWVEDIRQLSPRRMAASLGFQPGELDLLAGCPPCQGFSALRTLNGSKPRRFPGNELIREFGRFVRALQPRAVMMENVPGLMGHKRLTDLTGDLKSFGYTVTCRVIDAADYGVPQRRRRLVLVGGKHGAVPDTPTAKHHGSVRAAIGGLPVAGRSGDRLHDLGETRAPHIAELIRLIPKDGGSRGDIDEEYTLACHVRCNGFHDVYGRMRWDDVSPTITSGCVNPSKGRYLHPIENRSITLREAALLQTFPPNYYFSLRRGKFPAAAMIGNALPPAFMKQHARVLRRYLSAK